jgi:tetratricopeptide (TPR) repeat protein
LGTLLFAFALAPDATHGQDRPSDFGAWFLRTYGPADPKLVAKADGVFRRVLAVADQKSGRQPRLLVVDKPEGLEAQALPDGTIVINPALIRFCVAGARAMDHEGEARLAFVLGHEMAHLAYDDAWHAEAFAALRRYGDRDLADLTRDWVRESAAERQAKELRADRAGFMFMLMAGYPPQAIIDGRTDFLTEWARHAAGSARASDLQHPSFKDRSSVLRAQLSAVQAMVPFHHFGIRLLELGRHEDAIRMLERFRREVPSREANTNLGLAYAERALARLAECGSRDGLQYRLLTSVDPDTVATRLRLRGADGPNCVVPAREDFETAERMLREAYAQDKEYLPARLNLAAVLVLRGESLDAYRVATGAVDLRSQKELAFLEARLTNVAAVALHLAGHALPLDTTDSALSVLDDLKARLSDTDVPLRAAVAFNRARLLQDRGRAAAARDAWLTFLGTENRGPYADEARAALGSEAPPPPSRRPAVASDRLSARIAPAVHRRLLGAARQPFTLGDLRGAFLLAPDLWALELTGALELIDERLRPPLDATTMPSLEGALAVFDSGNGRKTLVFKDVAYDLEQGEVVRRLVFEPR